MVDALSSLNFDNTARVLGDVLKTMPDADHEVVKQILAQMEKITSDHELRIRYLERYTALGLGGIMTVITLLQIFSK